MRVIRLKAHNKKKNVDRIYEIAQTPGLFNLHVVTLRWGRDGTRGQTKSIGFETKEEAIKFVNERLRKRLNSVKRIGVNYHLVD